MRKGKKNSLLNNRLSASVRKFENKQEKTTRNAIEWLFVASNGGLIVLFYCGGTGER